MFNIFTCHEDGKHRYWFMLADGDAIFIGPERAQEHIKAGRASLIYTIWEWFFPEPDIGE